MAVAECAVFSEDGRLFGYSSGDGILKVFDVSAGSLIQEYTPNSHLSSPCSCLTWISSSKSLLAGKSPPFPKRKKNRLSGQDSVDVVVMGLLSGNILLYSTATGEVVCNLENGHAGPVNHLTWCRGTNLFSCGDDGHVVEWTVHSAAVNSKWKADNGKVTCILVLPGGESLLSASQTIKWWDLTTKQILCTFTGHLSYVLSLTLVSSPGCTDVSSMYILSGSRNERYISAWSLNKRKDCVATFAAADAVRSISVTYGETEQLNIMAAVTHTGVLNVFRHQLNGKRAKPLKPDMTVSVSSEETDKKTAHEIPIIAACFASSQEILIAHGHRALLKFERIPTSHRDKVVRLVRQEERRKGVSKQTAVAKVMVPVVEDVEFVTTAGPSSAPKRNRHDSLGVPLEKRLNNLTLSKLEKSSGVPKPDSMAQLLVQSLNSKDKKMLQSVLFTHDEQLIKNTVSRLPGQYVMPLLKELTARVVGRTHVSQVAAKWLKAVVMTQAGLLVSNPEMVEMLTPLQGMIEGRVHLLTPILRLQGRLDMLLGQVGDNSSKGVDADQLQAGLIVYQESDSDSSDTEDVLNGLNSGSEESGSQWSEQDDDGGGSPMEMEEDVLSSD